MVRRDPQHWTALGGPGVALTVSRAWFSYHPFRKSGLSACATKPAEPGADTQVPQETLETAAAVRSVMRGRQLLRPPHPLDCEGHSTEQAGGSGLLRDGKCVLKENKPDLPVFVCYAQLNSE